MFKKIYLTLLLVCFGIGISLAQTKKVSGTVKDASTNEGIPGVSVIVKGTTSGTTTDVSGMYSIDVTESATLVFQSVGMTSQEIVVGVQATIDVALTADTKQLNEVVITGLGEATDKRKVAISVESVNAKDFTNLPSASIDQALQGKVPGAIIQSVSGQPGQQQNIILRGINTLGANGMNGGTQPLILVDGVQVNVDNNTNGSSNNLSSRLADLDLTNVERVEVLQGAAASTLYGAQGANGVIQIFTKRGKANTKPTIDFSSTMGFNTVLRGNFKFADKHFYDTDANGVILGPGNVPLAPNATTLRWSQPLGNQASGTSLMNKPYNQPTYDHLNQIFRTARSWNNTLNIAGGGEKIQYAVSASNLDQESVLFGKLNRTSVRANLDFELFKGFKISTGTNFITSTNNTGTVTGNSDASSPMGTAVLTPLFVNFNVRTADGNIPGKSSGDNSTNPLFSYENRLFKNNVTRIIQSLELSYKPFKFLDLNYKFGYDHYNYTYRELIKNQEGYINAGLAPINGRLSKNLENGTNINSVLTAFGRINTKEDFKTDYELISTTQVAFDWRAQYYNGVSTTVSNLPEGEEFNLSQGSGAVVSENDVTFITYGFLVNQRFEYNNFLGISGGFRADWSSAFGAGSKPFIFPRGDVFIRLSELGFWQGLKKTIPELKLRGAIGAAGVQPGAYDRQVVLSNGTIGATNFNFPQAVGANSNLKVQTSTEIELGLDANITLGGEKGWFTYMQPSLTYWTRKAKNVIWNANAPLSTGTEAILDNVVELSSHGLQASLNVQVYDSEKFTWNFITNWGVTRNYIDKTPFGLDIPVGNYFSLKQGSMIGDFSGIRPLSSPTQTRADGSRYISDANLGNFEVVNGYVVNKVTKAVSFTNEKSSLGNATPNFNASFINNFTYDIVSLSIQLDWFYGQDVYNQSRQWMYRDMIHADITQPITVNGQTGAYTNYYNSLYQTNVPNSHFVERASFLRVRDISLRFDIGKKLKSKLLRSASLTLSGRNLLTFTKYTGIDPEAAAGLNSPISRGIDQFSFPNFRTYNIGLNVGF